MKPTRENHYTLYNERGERTAIIVDRKIYRVEALDDEGIAECFNGGDALPIMPQRQEVCD